MTFEILAIGTEILLGEIVDTNSQALGIAFAKHGHNHLRRTTVGDNKERVSAAIKESLSRADGVVCIGGLGPTQDDLTRDAIALALNDTLVEDAEIRKHLEALMQKRNRPWVEAMARQAMRPSCAKTFPNTQGSAPGLFCEKDGKVVIALPGPKNEFLAMLRDSVEPYLATVSDSVIATKTVKIIGMVELAVEQRIMDLVNGANPSVALYAKRGEVHLRIAAKAENVSKAEKLIQPILEDLRERFGKAIYAEDDRELAQVILEILSERKQTLATAESCTGGMLAERITAIPGSSESYLGGFVTYSNELKARELGVARVDIHQYGAVSEPVCRQMAEGVRRVTEADFGIGITGVAGPGQSEKKPAGLVFIGLASPRGTEVREENYSGDRDSVRFRATQTALQMLREELIRE